MAAESETFFQGILEIASPGDDCDGYFYHLTTIDVHITPGRPFPTRELAVQHATRTATQLGIAIEQIVEEIH